MASTNHWQQQIIGTIMCAPTLVSLRYLIVSLQSTLQTVNNFIQIFICSLNPYTTERRDVLENTPPEAQEISQGRGFCTPRPERLPEGEARGQSRGPRGAKSPHKGNLEGRGGCIFRYIPTRGSVRTFFHHYQGTIDFVA